MDRELQKGPSGFGELMLWLLSSLFLSGLALLAMGSAKVLLGWSDSQWIASSIAVTVLSATWGSWAALIWTRSRALRALMIGAAILPGALMIVVGVWLFLHMPENRFVWKWGWALLAVHGVGAVSIAGLLGSRGLFEKAPLLLRSRRLAIGWTLYPILIVVGSVGLVAGTFWLMPDMIGGSDAGMETLVRWLIPSQALVLLTTGLPALSAQICRRLTS